MCDGMRATYTGEAGMSNGDGNENEYVYEYVIEHVHEHEHVSVSEVHGVIKALSELSVVV